MIDKIKLLSSSVNSDIRINKDNLCFNLIKSYGLQPEDFKALSLLFYFNEQQELSKVPSINNINIEENNVINQFYYSNNDTYNNFISVISSLTHQINSYNSEFSEIENKQNNVQESINVNNKEVQNNLLEIIRNYTKYFPTFETRKINFLGNISNKQETLKNNIDFQNQKLIRNSFNFENNNELASFLNISNSIKNYRDLSVTSSNSFATHLNSIFKMISNNPIYLTNNFEFKDQINKFFYNNRSSKNIKNLPADIEKNYFNSAESIYHKNTLKYFYDKNNFYQIQNALTYSSENSFELENINTQQSSVQYKAIQEKMSNIFIRNEVLSNIYQKINKVSNMILSQNQDDFLSFKNINNITNSNYIFSSKNIVSNVINKNNNLINNNYKLNAKNINTKNVDEFNYYEKFDNIAEDNLDYGNNFYLNQNMSISNLQKYEDIDNPDIFKNSVVLKFSDEYNKNIINELSRNVLNELNSNKTVMQNQRNELFSKNNNSYLYDNIYKNNPDISIYKTINKNINNHNISQSVLTNNFQMLSNWALYYAKKNNNYFNNDQNFINKYNKNDADINTSTNINRYNLNKLINYLDEKNNYETILNRKLEVKSSIDNIKKLNEKLYYILSTNNYENNESNKDVNVIFYNNETIKNISEENKLKYFQSNNINNLNSSIRDNQNLFFNDNEVNQTFESKKLNIYNYEKTDNQSLRINLTDYNNVIYSNKHFNKINNYLENNKNSKVQLTNIYNHEIYQADNINGYNSNVNNYRKQNFNNYLLANNKLMKNRDNLNIDYSIFNNKTNYFNIGNDNNYNINHDNLNSTQVYNFQAETNTLNEKSNFSFNHVFSSTSNNYLKVDNSVLKNLMLTDSNSNKQLIINNVKRNISEYENMPATILYKLDEVILPDNPDNAEEIDDIITKKVKTTINKKFIDQNDATEIKLSDSSTTKINKEIRNNITEQIDEIVTNNLNDISEKVYTKIEKRLLSEKKRRGL